MREQTVTAKVYTTEIAYELPDGTQQVTAMFGKYNANRARAVIERQEGSQVLIKSIAHHWDKGRMSAEKFIKQAEIIATDKDNNEQE